MGYRKGNGSSGFSPVEQIDIVNNATVYIEDYKRQGAETDDTARLQRAVDDSPEGAKIVFDPNITYNIQSVVSTKALTIDVNGANLVVDPTTNGVTGTPVFWFKGSLDTQYNLTANVAEKGMTITLPTGMGANFAKYDYILLGDSKSVPSWDGTGYTYVGQNEINIVGSVSGDTITLAKPAEWDYNTTPFVQKINMLKGPRVINVGKISEVDPGAASSTANAGDPHLFQFQYCVLPVVDNVAVDGWQLHVVNFHRCVNGYAGRIQAQKPFRPTSGGHGYVVKYDNCWGGLAENNHALHSRHLVDWARSYDGKSQNNTASYNYGVAFYMHGLGSRRCKSVNDEVFGMDSGSEGWAMGNSDFNADYDYVIVNPKYRGQGIAIGMKTLSKRMTIINPDIKTKTKYAVGMSRGAEDFVMTGGTVENNDTGGLIYGLLARAETADGATGGVNVKNVSVKGTKFKGNAMVFIDALGTIDVAYDSDVTLGSSGTNINSPIRISASVAATDLFIRNCTAVGTFERGVYISTAPTRFYKIEANAIAGQTNTGYQVRAANNLRMQNNDCIDAANGATLIAFSSDIVAAKAAGAIVKNNRPSTYDS